MSNEQAALSAAPTGEGAPYIQLFQKAHQKIVILDRLEEQIAQLLGKREEAQDELKALQEQINGELEHRINQGIESPAKVLSAIAGSVTGRNGIERMGMSGLTNPAQ